MTPMENRFPKIQYSPTPAGTIKAKKAEKATMNAVIPHWESLFCSIWSTLTLFCTQHISRADSPASTGMRTYPSRAWMLGVFARLRPKKVM